MAVPTTRKPKAAPAAISKISGQVLLWRSPEERDHVALPVWRAALYRSPRGKSPLDLRVAFEIAAFADRTGACSASNETIAERAGTDVWRAKDAIAALEACGLLIRQTVPRHGANRTGRAIRLALPTGGEGGDLSPPLELREGGGTLDLKGVTGTPPNTDNTPRPGDDVTRDVVLAAADRLNRKKAMAFRVFRDGVADGDKDEIARAAEMMQAALDEAGGRT